MSHANRSNARVVVLARTVFLALGLVALALGLAASGGTLGQAHAGDEAPVPRHVIDSSRGEIRLEVKKRGALKAFAHDHDMTARVFTGTVVWSAAAIDRASVELRIATKEIAVLDPQLSADDRASIQKSMQSSDVLDVAKYPEIAFVSQSVVAHEKDAEGKRPLSVMGKLTLHGVARQTTLAVTLAEKDSGELEVVGDYVLKQTDYGIEPFSTGFGTVGVQDDVTIRFHVFAKR